MKRQKQWWLLLVLVLALALAACGGGNDEVNSGNADTAVETNTAVADPTDAPEPTDEPEPTAVPEPTAEPEPTDEPEPTAEPEPTEAEAPAEDERIDLSAILSNLEPGAEGEGGGIASFNSYVYLLTLTFTGTDDAGAEVTQAVDMTFTYSQDPPAASMQMMMEGIEGAEEFGQIAIAQIEDSVYMVIPGLGCIPGTTQDMDLLGGDNPMSDAFSPEQMLAELDAGEARRVLPDETIDGIEVEHYVFDETMIDDPEAEVEQAEGHLYVAKDGGYPVRMEFEVVGNLDGFGADGGQAYGTLNFAYSLSSINEPVDVTIPAECENVSTDIDLPLMDDAYELTSFAGFVSYKSDAAFADVMAFYENALAEAGWVKDEAASFELSGTASLAYTRDGESLTLMISENEDDGATDVLLMTAEE
ncbi:MAG: hypothetical protein KC425_27545 [Anaerolineales bacterium]|nr:hypothetical protein [Anaerolineales bacterium]